MGSDTFEWKKSAFKIYMEEVIPIENQLSSRDLFDAFKSQLTKDFEQSNFPSDFIKDLPADYTRIHEKIVDELHRSETRADTNVMTLLYSIDISEAQLKKYLREHADKNHLVVIADLIIKRVLQKVVIKKFYKQSE
ncbi:MAG: hypothetical protein HYZ44_15385 [Bacteroidetes bacterium]|nr:hypothetical protein [Bacteroidota bacterium]